MPTPTNTPPSHHPMQDSPGWHHALSPWEEGLRCWRFRDRWSARRPHLLMGEWLDPGGHPRDADRGPPLGDRSETAPPDPVLQAALRPFLERIPLTARRLAAPFGRQQWLALEALSHLPPFGAFLTQELTGAGPAFVAASWIMGRVEHRPLAERLAFCQRLMTVPRCTFFAQLTELPCRPVFFRLLGRVGPDPLTPETIWQLLECVQSPTKCQALGMVGGELTPQLVGAVAALPVWLALPRVVAALAELGPELRELGMVFPPALLEAPPGLHTRIAASLKGVQGIEPLEERIAQWSQRLAREGEFPPPPIPGSRLLTPIRCGAELLVEGREMAHCVAGYAKEVAEGRSHFFRWHGRERATVQLRREPGGPWRVVEHLGRHNRRLEGESIRGILGEVARQMPEGLFLLETHVAGLPYYRAEEVAPGLERALPVELLLHRQPENPHDRLAIEVLTREGVKLGYIPRHRNAPIAELLDGGLPVRCRLVECATFLGQPDLRLQLHLLGNPLPAAPLSPPVPEPPPPPHPERRTGRGDHEERRRPVRFLAECSPAPPCGGVAARP